MTDVLVLPFVAPTQRHRLVATLMVLTGVFCLFWLGAKPGAGQLFPNNTDKLAHLVAFGGLASVLWVMVNAQRAWLVVLVTAAVGAADEISQAFHPGRQASLADWLCDFAAAMLVVAVLTLARRWWIAGRPPRA